jgi:hypothetical protein
VTIDEDAVRGVILKVNRAHEHFTALKREIDAWNGRKPYRLVAEVHANGGKHFLRVKLLEPIPVEWSVVVGEAVHDLRSALEQIIYQLTLFHSGRRDLDGCGFPIYSKRSDFEKRSKRHPSGWARDGGRYKIRGTAPSVQLFIEELQPYPQRYTRSVHHSLAGLHELWNQDKHRLVHLWGLRFNDAKITIKGTGDRANCVPVFFSDRVLSDGAIAVKITCDPPRSNVEVSGPAVANVAIKDPVGRDGGAQSLWTMYGDTANVLAKLVGALNRPTERIDIDTWHPQAPRRL